MSDAFLSTTELLTQKQAGGHKELKEEIIGMRMALKQAMDRGLTVSGMETARTLADAVEAADTAVDKMYAKMFG